MKILGRVHETLIRRVDKNNPQSDYYEIYPISTASSIYMDQSEETTLMDFLSEMRYKYDIYVENIQYPITSVQVYNGSQFGEIKKGDVLLSAKDFGLDQVDNTPDNIKPISEPQKKYIETYTKGIIDDINFIIGNATLWNTHVLDMNNPHRVTWQQVTNNSSINPEDLVDHPAMETAIAEHNNETDLTKLHPYLVSQIQSLQVSLTELQKQLATELADLQATITSETTNAIQAHNVAPDAHPDILTKLGELQIQITDILDKYSGLTGVEYTSNRVDELDLLKVFNITDTTYDEMYPSMLAVKDLILNLMAYGFPNVEHRTKATSAEVNVIVGTNLNGILFVDELDGVGGTYIIVYQRGGIVSSYKLPDPVPNARFAILNNAPTSEYMESTYGDASVIVFCSRSTSYPDFQSIVCWYNHTLTEFVIDTMHLGNGEKLFSAAYSYSEPSNVASYFPSGYGILLVEKMSTSQLPGIILYNKDSSPQTRSLYYGYKVEPEQTASTFSTMRMSPVESNMKQEPKTMVETVPFIVDYTGTYEHEFFHKYLDTPEVIVVLSGMETIGGTTTITADATVLEVSKTDVKINHKVNGVKATFTIYITGKVQ